MFVQTDHPTPGDGVLYEMSRKCFETFGLDGEYHPSCCRFPKACSPYHRVEPTDVD